MNDLVECASDERGDAQDVSQVSHLDSKVAGRRTIH